MLLLKLTNTLCAGLLLASVSVATEYKTLEVQARANCLDTKPALLVNLPPGNHTITLDPSQSAVTYAANGAPRSADLAIRVHDHAAVDMLFVLHVYSPKLASSEHFGLKKGGFLQAFFVDDYAADNSGKMILLIDGNQYTVDPKKHTLNPEPAVQFKFPNGPAFRVSNLTGRMRYGEDFPLGGQVFVRCLTRKDPPTVEYFLLCSDCPNSGVGSTKFNNETCMFFFADELAADNTGSITIRLTSVE